MQQFGGINQQSLSLFGNSQSPEGGAPGFGSRMFDSDGDGRMDLFLLDFDNDGTVDKVVRGIDSNRDGVNDTFISYNEDGSIESIGRMNPATGEMETIYEEPGIIEEILATLGLLDLESPEQALFTSFNDPYIMTTYGTFGEEVPLEPIDSLVVEPGDIIESDAAPSQEAEGATVVDTPEPVTETASSDSSVQEETSGKDQQTEAEVPEGEESSKAETTAKVTEIRDTGAADSSTAWARVDRDGDNLADDEVLVSKVGDDYMADINRDGVSEDIATDMDHDGRMDTVDTTGKGSSTDQVDASAVVSPDSAHLADQPGEDDGVAEVSAEPADSAAAADIDSDVESASVTAEPYDAPDTSSSVDASPDTGVDAGASTTASTYDAGSTTDTGSSTTT
jgi:hypothetical protein